MEQLYNYNAMLTGMQVPQERPAAKKSESAEKDGFQKLLEQKQGTETQAAPKQEKAEAPQKTEAKEAPESQEPQQVQTEAGNGKELEEQMVLAAVAMLQNPVVPVEEVQRAVEIRGGAMDQVAALAAPESTLAPEDQTFVPETERAVEPSVENGTSQTPEFQAMAEEIPQAVEAPEAAEHAEERTVEVKVERGGDQAQAERTEESGEEPPELQDADVEAPVFREVKAVPVKVGEAPKAEAAEKPVEEQIAPKLTEALNNGETRVELQLAPENLGKVTVEMTWSENGGLVVQLHAENRHTQDLLSKNMNGLAELLGRESQQEVRVEVPRQEESQRQDLYEQQQEQHRQQRQQERRSQQTDSEAFLQQLRLGLIPVDGE